MDKVRCGWCVKSELEQNYHDTEWGVPATNDRVQFEFITLEAAQAGLSWLTVLKKREGYRKAFAAFNPEAVSRFGPADVERLVQDAAIIRNRKKIEAAISNSHIFLELAARHGSFSRWFWSFVDARPVINKWKDMKEIPPSSPLSDKISKEMKRLGFKFMGSTVLYAHMQATGMINDHIVSCFRHNELCQAVKNGLDF